MKKIQSVTGHSCHSERRALARSRGIFVICSLARSLHALRLVGMTVFVAITFFSISISSAFAEVFYVENDKGRFSMSFPDSWALGHNQKPDEMLTVRAPGMYDYASCKMRVREDKRFTIYPVRYSGEIQRSAYSKGFWFGYLDEYTDPYLAYVTDGGGLVRGFASYAEAFYTTAVGPKMVKQAIMFVSLYNDKVYILECSAEIEAYPKWHKAFLSVAKSIDFTKSISEKKTGHYDPGFLARSPLVIYGERPFDDTYH